MKGFLKFRKKMIKHYLDAGINLNSIEHRMSGRSTAIALKIISEALSNPDKEIQIRDHHFGEKADFHLHEMIYDICEKLNFEGFAFNRKRGKFSIIFSFNDKRYVS